MTILNYLSNFKKTQLKHNIELSGLIKNHIEVNWDVNFHLWLRMFALYNQIKNKELGLS